MSNIQTSYIRIYRKDGKGLLEAEIERLFKLAVTSYGEFGSYWVRVLKIYREIERCLDIQFGSGKRYHSGNLLEDKDIFDEYYVWERFSDEGGFQDTLFTLKENSQNNWIETTTPVPCLYKFNKVKLICDELPSYFKEYNFEPISSTEYELKIEESYNACNSRSFMDVYEDSEFKGPKLGYDPYYASDYFVPTKDGGVTDSNYELIKDTFVYPHKQLTKKVRMELYWNNRLVQVVENKYGEVDCYSADYWDNCNNKEFLEFKRKIKK